MSKKTEEWRPVPREVFSDRFEVSSLGRVRRSRTGEMCKAQRPRRSGIRTVYLCAKGQCWAVAVSRLMALAFLGDPPTPLHRVNFKDDNPENCRVDNLKWVSRVEDTARAFRLKLRSPAPGSMNGNATLTDEQVREMRSRPYSFGLYAALSREFGVSENVVQRAYTGLSYRNV